MIYLPSRSRCLMLQYVNTYITATVFRCNCEEVYTGKDCDTTYIPCQPSLCQNGGQCSPLGLYNYTCQCPTGNPRSLGSVLLWSIFTDFLKFLSRFPPQMLSVPMKKRERSLDTVPMFRKKWTNFLVFHFLVLCAWDFNFASIKESELFSLSKKVKIPET